MEHRPQHEPQNQSSRSNRARNLTILSAVTVLIIVVVLHLTGTIGANSH